MSGSWLEQLQPASWRGIPFAVKTSEYRRGRRPALHEYPKRPLPWLEDMGQATRVVGFSGFVVGDDCFEQAQALLAASEQEGPGQLVHPSLGLMTVSLIEPLTASERADLGRVVEIRFEFVEGGAPLYPDNSNSTQDQVNSWGDQVQSASADAFTSSVGGPSPNDAGGTGSTGSASTSTGSAAPSSNDVGGSSNPTTYTDSNGKISTIPPSTSGIGYQANTGVSVANTWGDMASQQSSDPALTANAAASVPPPDGTTYGRFDGAGVAPSGTAGLTAQQAIDEQVQQRNTVDDAGDAAARAAAIS